MSISKIIENGMQGAIATVVGGTAICLTGPVGLLALATTAAVSTASGTAIGTAIGGTSGVVFGTIEEVKKN